MSSLKEDFFDVEKQLDKIKSSLAIFNEFAKHLKQGDIIYIPEISYSPFCNGYHPLEVQDTSRYIYCLERSIMKEHYLGYLEFYVRDSKGDFVKSSSIKDLLKIEQVCKVNREYSDDESK